ncbi:MAG: peptide chain release factor N(5)-glutamine methyltransferase [Actinomycetota bacterium]
MTETPWSEIWAETRQRLDEAGLETAALETRWLIEDVAGITDPTSGESVAQRHLAKLDAMVARRLRGEPIQYVLGHWSFRELDLLVDRRVLIPRPETEVVTQVALDELTDLDEPRAVDLGTGSGAIAISLVREHRTAQVWATDRSAEAVAVARANAAGAGGRAAARLRVVEGDWFDALPVELRGGLDLVVSNPPYVSDDEDLPAAVADWEPGSALRAGPGGWRDLEHLLGEAPAWLAPGGALVLEHAPQQAEPLRRRADEHGYVEVTTVDDLAGRPRALRCRMPRSS